MRPIPRFAALAAAVLSALALALAFSLFQPAPEAEAGTLTRMRVIDGDTLRDLSKGVTYRLVNIDTPETGENARCPAERALGDAATRRARALVSGAVRVETREIGRIDTYGRTIAYVLVDGQDLGEALISEGLARPWRGRREPWCDAAGRLIP